VGVELKKNQGYPSYMIKALAFFFTVFAFTLSAHSEEIAMSRSGDFYSIQVTFDQAHAVPMIVDTGASEHIVTDWFAVNSGFLLKGTKEEDSDSGGRSFKVYRADISSMGVGTQTQKAFKLAVVHFDAFKQEAGIVGLFSPQTFYSKTEVLIDFPRHVLRTPPDIRMKEMKVLEKIHLYPCSRTEPLGMIEAKVNGVDGHFLLDTGGFKSTIKAKFAPRLGKLKTETAWRNGVAGKRKVDRVKGLQFKVGSISTSLTADIENNFSGCTEADGKLGIEFLSRFGLLFNQAHDKVSFVR
jgi:predicted aspartyl protease